MVASKYAQRSDKWRVVETIAGFLLVGAAIVGALLYDTDKLVTLVFVGLGGIFISKTKTLELLEKIKGSLPRGG